ncbi:MAG: DUF1501 domain-containing protein [Pirellulaceae bacterium]
MKNPAPNRRQFLAGGAAVASAAALGGPALLSASDLLSASESPTASLPPGKADSCIFIWLGGGACHVDTWDPKRRGDPKTRTPGSDYDAIDTAIEGAQVCEHLKRTAPLLDRGVLLRSVNHDVIDEHAAATNRVHTGRPPTGTTVYPSIGSIVAHQLGARGEGVPAYVVMGYPSASRGPGFLGAKYSYVYLTDTELGPAGLKRPDGVSAARQDRRNDLLAKVRQRYVERNEGDRKIADYAAASAAGMDLAGPKFMSVFDLKSESDKLRETYGGEFGQRCLLARRLIESGVRFVEVSFNLNFINGTGWDTHNAGQLNQHILIDQLDQALAALVLDLEHRRRLDKTLIVVATEFGRPPEFDGGGGRGHQSKAFSIMLAGGSLKTGQAVGVTDELGKTVVERPISVPDLHATIHHTLGIDPALELFDGDRPVPITDRGAPLRDLFA